MPLSSSERGRVLAVLGPTNTGKTHLAVERMLGHHSGVMGLPLRLLAREIYDRVVGLKGKGRVALVTGEERIIPTNAQWYVCTVEAMPLDRDFDFLAIDEIQLCADPDRGHVFTDRLLRARGREETMFLGSDTAAGLIRRLVPQAESISRPRLSKLTYVGPKKLSRLPRRAAIVAFSAQDVYAIAELIRRQRGGAAVVLGALSPRTRNAQVAMFQAREVDFLVATDAIGMGLNMAIEHVAFAELRKFDGETARGLTPAEVGQIAGRAGRHMNDGTFGATGELDGLPPDIVEKVEEHRFDPIRQARWRNTELDFSGTAQLLRSLEAPPPLDCLVRARDAEDYLALRSLGQNGEIIDRCRSRDRLRLLWQICQIPDFRKTSLDSHVRLLAQVFLHLTTDEGRLPTDWVARQVASQERTDGDIDTLAARIAHIRTWTYISHREDWIANAEHWQERSRAIEDRLSDALHERLTQRFVDRRTAVLLSRLKDRAAMTASIADDGDVTVEGQFVGRLHGLTFVPDSTNGGNDGRALRAAANRSLGPAFAQRAKALAAASDREIHLNDDARLIWRDAVLARLTPGDHISRPRIKLLGGEQLAGVQRDLIQQRLDEWLRQEVKRQLSPLLRLEQAELSPTARGLAFRLNERLGKLPRRDAREQLRHLPQAERRKLHEAGLRFGRRWLFLPAILKPASMRLCGILWSVANGVTTFAPPPAGRIAIDLATTPDPSLWAAMGFEIFERRAVRIDMLERLLGRVDSEVKAGPVELSAHHAALIAAKREELPRILRSLGYRTEVAEEKLLLIAGPEHRGGGKRVRMRNGAAGAAIDQSSPFAKLKEIVAAG